MKVTVQGDMKITVQGDQKDSLHLIIMVRKNTQIYFKQFQSLTMITYVELGITDGVSVFENTVQRVNKCLETGGGHFEHYFLLSVL
jgi:hypothetical protein